MPNFYRKLVSVQKKHKKPTDQDLKKKIQIQKKKVSYWDTPTTGYREVMELNQTASLGECECSDVQDIGLMLVWDWDLSFIHTDM